MPVIIDQCRGKIGCFINRIASNFFFCLYDTRSPSENLLPVSDFLLRALFLCTSSKYFLIWVRFCTKLRLEISRYTISLLFYMFFQIYYLLCCSSLILLSRDINTNPGPISSSGQYFSICHWKLSSTAAHNYTKFSLLTASNLVHSFDITCLSETFLNLETPTNDIRLEYPGYNMFRSDHPSNKRKCLHLL